MAKKKQTRKRTAKAPAQSAGMARSGNHGSNKRSGLSSISRRNALRGVAVAVVAVGAGVAIHRHDVQARELHDLAAVGKGVPTVVQIHDPSCPKCRSLMSATRKAMEDFPTVDYRIADITTSEGSAFQGKYNVPHVTLLLFDAAGRRVETLTGVRTADELRKLFAASFDSLPASQSATTTPS